MGLHVWGGWCWGWRWLGALPGQGALEAGLADLLATLWDGDITGKFKRFG